MVSSIGSVLVAEALAAPVRKRGGHSRRVRFWQRVTAACLNVEATFTWFHSDDVGETVRKIDRDLEMPDWVWRPYCLLRRHHRPDGAPRFSDGYSACVYCRKMIPEWPPYYPAARPSRWALLRRDWRDLRELLRSLDG